MAAFGFTLAAPHELRILVVFPWFPDLKFVITDPALAVIGLRRPLKLAGEILYFHFALVVSGHEFERGLRREHGHSECEAWH
jgi:hypothetical protein